MKKIKTTKSFPKHEMKLVYRSPVEANAYSVACARSLRSDRRTINNEPVSARITF